MKKAISILLSLILVAFSCAALAESQTVRIGGTPVPHVEILEFIKPLMAEKGFELEISTFNDYVIPNTAVEDGSLDANYFQHIAYLNNFNQENGTHLVAVIPVHFEPMGVFKGRTNPSTRCRTAPPSACRTIRATRRVPCCCWKPWA